MRHVMVEGASGVLAVASAQQRSRWYPSRRLLIWENGCKARCFAAEAPDQLRGPEFEHGLADEIAKWQYPEALDNLLLPLRRGDQPRLRATTTPRPLSWLKQLAQAPDTVLVRRARAMRAKQERAQPIAAAYARGEVRHAGVFETLCDQMCALKPGA